MDINEWTAKECGIDIVGEPVNCQLIYMDGARRKAWNIQDPRCREIVRERFKLDTYQTGEDLYCCCESVFVKIKSPSSYGKTIAEAEIACITEIHSKRVGV